MLFGKKKSNTPSTTSSTVNSSAAQPASTSTAAKVILTKAEDGLDRHIVRLKKEGKVDLTKHRTRVFVVVDRSGSMNGLFKNGSVQNTLTRLLPLALRFDDNGELEVYVFDHECSQLSPMTINNYENYVEDEILRKGYGPRGGTSYAPVIKKTVSDYNDGSPYPAFGIFITDGANNDEAATDKEVRNSSKYKIFYQFVGIGGASFSYLEKLDDLDGRAVDNTAFVKVADFSKLDDEQLYALLLEQYTQWLSAMNLN